MKDMQWQVPLMGSSPELLIRPNRRLALKKVVFVCVENSNRSQMAEAFARIHGAGKVEAFSAGSRPSGRESEGHRSHEGTWLRPDHAYVERAGSI